MLQIYNSFTNQKEEFVPIEAGKVRMYVCGMTVYDYCHLGHARVLVAFDVVVRYLRSQGYDVTYVRNITDIDDKIIQRAHEKGEKFQVLTERFIQAMHEDSAALNVLPPDLEPKATDSIALIISMIQKLIAKDFAYAAANGDVYYRVKHFANYGLLSGKKIEELQVGARVEVDDNKEDPLDFVLWKAAKPEEPSWESPWGAGRPGWHIECSAMSAECLGHHFDIHGGGMDLQFPHHENEIAQSEAANDCKFANVWMHNGFVRVDEEKMSKSLGNFFTIREILEKYHPEEVRYFILNSQYRSPLNYSDAQLENAKASLQRLYTALKDANNIAADFEPTAHSDKFKLAMDDDFNTAGAMSVLHELAGEINREKTHAIEKVAALAAELKHLAAILGILQLDPIAYLQGLTNNKVEGLSVAEIEEQIQLRTQAKAQKDFSLSDKIRDQLLAQGIVLEDSANGTTWRKK